MRNFAKVFQSAIAAVVVSAALWGTAFLANDWLAMRNIRKHLPPGTGYVHGVSTFYLPMSSPYGRLLSAAIVLLLIAVFWYCFSRLKRDVQLPLPFVGAVISFAVSWTVMFLLISVGLSTRDTHRLGTVVEMIAFFATWLAVCSFYAGALGGWWLESRSPRIHTMGRLMVEAAIAGVALGSIIPLCYVLFFFSMNGSTFYSPFSTTVSPRILAASAFGSIEGLLIAESFAVVFRRRFVARDESRNGAS